MLAPDALSEGELQRPLRTSKAKQQHNSVQLRFLTARDLLSGDLDDHAAIYETLAEIASDDGLTASLEIPAETWQRVENSYNRLIYLNEGERCAQSAVNPKLDFAKIQTDYHAKKPEITYCYNFLTDEALRRLRKFCLES